MQLFTKQLTSKLPFFDIAANLTDTQFGNNKHHHEDRDTVVKRAQEVGCSHLIIAAGSLEEARHSFELC